MSRSRDSVVGPPLGAQLRDSAQTRQGNLGECVVEGGEHVSDRVDDRQRLTGLLNLTGLYLNGGAQVSRELPGAVAGATTTWRHPLSQPVQRGLHKVRLAMAPRRKLDLL